MLALNLMWNSYTEEKHRVGFNSFCYSILCETRKRCLLPLKWVRKMLKTLVQFLKKFWGMAIISWYVFTPVPPFGTLDKCPLEKQMRMSPICMSCAASARTRAPLLMILSSPTCYTYLACIIITPSSHLDSIFFFSFSKQLLSVSAFFFHMVGC